ncbi:hypothetical protein GLOIN_2v1787971 [Rhizophagus clarus]|uniref:F-box domain-containing protein n=1 Tax=Rhizophagus clarus TaxID=94130 RepID=A0A8H3M6Y3_9GLOM|nr:hypothetical protein GLOIN_2v1787971 [Rhizophagus clarus]
MELDEDVLFLIFEELQNDAKSLHSCLLVNRSWCVTAIPVLWRDPEKYFKTVNPKRIKKLSNVIFLHLSEESRNILNDQGIKNPIITGKYQQPAFNYINLTRMLKI